MNGGLKGTRQLTLVRTLNNKFGLSAALTALFACALCSGCRVSVRLSDLSPQRPAHWTLSAGTPVKGKIHAVGAASAPFIPTHPVALSGFGSPSRRFLPPLLTTGGDVSFCRPYQKIENPPLIKAAIFKIHNDSQKNEQLILFSLDLIAVTNDLTDKIHQTVATTLQKSDVSLSNTFVLATHTHSGPAGLTESPLWSAFVCDQFNRDLSEQYLAKVTEVLQQATRQLQPVTTIETVTTQQPSLFKSRFTGMTPATDITLVSFKSPSGKTPLSLVQLAAHPTVLGPRDLTLSADLIAPLESALRSSTGADEVFTMQTMLGNMDAEFNNETSAQWAKRVSDSLQTTQTTRTEFSDLSTSTFAGQVSLPSPEINWTACGAKYAKLMASAPILEELPNSAPFTFWRFATTTHLFLPGEWTTGAGQQLMSSFSREKGDMKIISLANDYTAYHVTEADYGQKELESCSSIYGRSALSRFTETLSKNEAFWNTIQ
jgi:hypothetical protein